MKTTIKLFTALLFLSFTITINAQGDEKVENPILGEWENKRFQVEYNFTEDGNAYFAQAGFGQNMDYTIDTSKAPIWLNFKVSQGNYKATIPALVKIVDENTIWIEQFSPSSEHPTEFSENGVNMNKMHVLTRIK